MNLLLNDMLLFFISILFLILQNINAWTTIALLSAIIFAASSYLYRKQQWLTFIHLLYLILSISQQEFFYTLPLILYNTELWKQQEFQILPLLLNFLPLLFHLSFNAIGNELLWLLAMGLAVYMNHQTCAQAQLEKDFKKQRDASRELAMVLSEKNKNLLIQQEQEIRIATLNERNRIAREIHDNVGHLLSSALLQIGALQALFPQEELQEPLSNLRATISTGMDSVRSSVHDLHDEALDLHATLLTLLKKFTFCKSELIYDVNHSISEDMVYHILAIVKECMNNTMKHSNANLFQITIREQPTFYQVICQDNGTIIKLQENGIGLKNIRERVEGMHGFLNIQTECGFCVFITLPKEDKTYENTHR